MNKFTVDFVCPGRYEYLAAEISFDRQIVCRINCEREDGELMIEFFFDYRDKLDPIEFPLSDFLGLVNSLSSELRELRAKRDSLDGGIKAS
jgi:hypothetical protein